MWATTQAIKYHFREQAATIADKMNKQTKTPRAITEADQHFHKKSSNKIEDVQQNLQFIFNM